MNHDVSTFLCGCGATIEALFFAKTLDELADDDTENSSFFVMLKDQWLKYKFAGAWMAVSMATIKPQGGIRTVCAVSPRGAYWEGEPKSLHETHGEIGEDVGPLRYLTSLEDVIYACGMGRTVLRRKGPGAWEEIGPGTTAADGDGVIGFEGLAGFSADDMYAVGWGGEIWHRRKGRWRRIDSPVSANLNAVCCAGDGKVYIVGDGGVLVRGRNDVWEVLEQDLSNNLMDVSFFDKTVYVTTDFEILKLQDDDLVSEDAFADPDDLPDTCLHLIEASDGLFSMGPKDLFRLVNGVWERLV